MRVCLRHNIKWLDDIFSWYAKDMNPLVRRLISLFLSMVKRASRGFLEVAQEL